VTVTTSNCPNCGGEIRFLWPGAVQTTCPYCRSILVRTDIDLRRVGEVSTVPPSTSRIRIGARGSYRGRAFTVVGRIVYEYERGRWSEWHLGFADGASGWLSDAQAEYAVSFLVPDHGPLPASDQLRAGTELERNGGRYQVSTVTRAHYVAVEGELPFEYWDGSDSVFVDLRAPDGRFSTIDFSDEQPLLYDGEVVGWDDLHLTGLAAEDDEVTRVQGTVGFNCPKCGSAIALRDPDNTVNVACESCGTVVDATSGAARILQEYLGKVRVKPLIPLGTFGTLHGHKWQVIGFQQRTMRAEGHDYSWREYLLRNPEQGYRYLTEYDGHWSDVAPLRGVPEKSGVLEMTYAGETFKHFQTATSRTSFVLGEFPWQVRLGDEVEGMDYVSPPRMLSREDADGEQTWSVGEYVTGDAVWRAFGLPGEPPKPKGVFANQPNPKKAGLRWIRTAFVLSALLLVGGCLARVSSAGRTVTEERFGYIPGGPAGGAVASSEFTLDGRTSNVEVEIRTNLDNGWGYFDLALIDAEHGTAKEVGREVSYYHGMDEGESWSEGSEHESVTIPEVPPGRYFLRIGVEAQQPMGYTVTVKRDVPDVIAFLVVFVLLAIPWIIAEVGPYSFEVARWAESDHPKTSSSDDDDD
jgi:hypothetical protein